MTGGQAVVLGIRSNQNAGESSPDRTVVSPAPRPVSRLFGSLVL